MLLFKAGQHARVGQLAEARALCEAARGRVRPGEWRRAAARIAREEGKSDEARALFRQVADEKPTALDAHSFLASDLADREGVPAALAFLESWAERAPHNVPVWRLYAEWMRRGDPEQAETRLRRLLAISPRDAWTHRELGWNLAQRHRFAEAEEALRRALEIDPHHPFAHAALARVLRESARPAEAVERCRASLSLDAGSELALDEWLVCCSGPEERRAALAFLHAELSRQGARGDGLAAWHRAAEGALPPAQVLAGLEALRARWPSQWEAPLALARQLCAMGRLDEAADVARAAAERFPLLPAAQLEQARVARARGENAEERAALERAVEVAPGWSEARRTLAEWHDARGELDAARAQLERAVARVPRDALNRGFLADVLWRQGRPESRQAAAAEVEAAVRLDPGYAWAWERLEEWSEALGRADEAPRVAREIAARRADDPSSWVLVARRLARPEDLSERLAALDRALALAPRLVEAHALKAELLKDARRFGEAREACWPAAFEGRRPAQLVLCEAKVRAAGGDVAGAMGEVRSLVAAEPDHYDGWAMLVEWAVELGEPAAAVEAARRLAELRPTFCAAHGWLGHALDLAGDKAGARAAFERALQLDASYTFAARWAFELGLEGGDLTLASRALEALRGRVPEAGVLEREVRLACRGSSPDGALALLRQLCEAPGDDAGPLRRAVEALTAARRGESAEAVLEAQVVREEASAACGAAWADLWSKRGDGMGGVERAERLLCGSRAPAAFRAAVVLLEQLADAGRSRAAARLVRRCGAWLANDDSGWGEIGHVLYRLDRLRAAAAWLSGWRERKGPRAWMVGNLGAALLALGRAGEAFAIYREALKLEHDGSSSGHQLTAALGEALEARDEAALAPALAQARAVERRSGRADEEFVLGLIEALEEGAKAPAVPLRQTAALERLSKARQAHPNHLADLGDASLLALVLRRLAVGRPAATRIWVIRERARVWMASRGILFKRRIARLLAMGGLV